MPAPNYAFIKQVLTFVRESWFNVAEMSSWIRRNKLAALLLFTNAALFLMAMFMTEQSIQRQRLVENIRVEMRDIQAQSKNLAGCTVVRDKLQIESATCQNQVSLLQTDYKELNRALDRCHELADTTRPQTPPAPPKQHPMPALPNPTHHRKQAPPQSVLDNIPE